MKVSLDTSIIIEIERKKEETIELIEKLLNFEIVPLNTEIAEIMGQINAFLITNGSIIEYQDVAIAATFLYKSGDYLLTGNKKHFTRIPELKDKTLTPDEASRMV